MDETGARAQHARQRDGRHNASSRPALSAQGLRALWLHAYPQHFALGVAPYAQTNASRHMHEAAAGRSRLPASALPNHSVDMRESVVLGGLRVQLLHWAPAHTDGDLVVFFPDLKLAFVGDILAMDQPCPLTTRDRPSPPSRRSSAKSRPDTTDRPGLAWHGGKGILIAPDGKHAYVAANNDNHIAQIDLTTLTVSKQRHTGPGPDGMAGLSNGCARSAPPSA